jgi:hypothetical protein
LNAKITISCEVFGCSPRPFSIFPFSAFKLVNLRSFVLKSYPNAYIYPLRLNGELPIPSSAHKSLRKFRLEISQSFSVLKLVNDAPLLDDIFPNLKSLYLAFSSVALSGDHMKAVPRGLEELTLISRYFSCTESLTSSKILQDLPLGLKLLHISSRFIAPDSDGEDFSTIVWPPQLSSLFLKVDQLILQHLPANLEALSLVVAKTMKTPSAAPLPTSIFPRSLKVIKVISVQIEDFLFRPTTFPPELDVCLVDFAYDGLTASDWVHLPKSIRQFNTPASFLRFGALSDLLPNLERFSKFFGLASYPADLLANLPPRLVEFHCMVPLSGIPNLPPTLTSLHIRGLPLSASSSPNVGDLTRLPLQLTVLHLGKSSPYQFFCKDDFALLPATLTHLSFQLDDIQDADTLSVLPSGLTSLAVQVGSHCQGSTRCDSQLLSNLPSGIRQLSIIIAAVPIVWTSWMRNLGRYKALESLSVSLDDSEFATSPPVHLDFLDMLPQNLQRLELTLDRTQLTPNVMMGLPKNLFILALWSLNSPETRSFASDECFANLPKTIGSLKLPKDMEGLTSRIFSLLPSTLTYLSGPTHLFAQSNLLFDREAIEWGDYRPR